MGALTAADMTRQFDGMLPHLTGVEREMFRQGRDAFIRKTSVQGDAYLPNTEIGLGPRYNGDSCVMCHAYPAVGGSSPKYNPQIASASAEGAVNVVPSFLTLNSPVLQVRFRLSNDGKSDGSVHPLFTIRGRRDAQGCDITQPNFESEVKRGNLSFRIPTPLFGAGLIEAISTAEIEANASSHSAEKHALGIEGRPNRIGPDGSVGRFGWKAHAASLESFVAEAYAIEEGVSNELFPHERQDSPGTCLFNATPEDRFSPFFSRSVDALSNVSRVATFLRFLAPPPVNQQVRPLSSGARLFERLGCSECHTPLFVTKQSSHPVLNDQAVPLYSDLLLHHMGARLADGIREEDAGPDDFRTAPLWGVSKRLFLLHDGRTSDLVEAILEHSGEPYAGRRSEADEVVAHFRALTPQERDELVSFLKTL